MSQFFLGKRVLVRTHSAGVFFGEIVEKEKDSDRLILKDSRQLWQYKCKKSLSLSGVATKGIVESGSLICPVVPYREVTAIEILSVSEEFVKSIDGCPDAQQRA
jgi:hypothetical protein